MPMLSLWAAIRDNADTYYDMGIALHANRKPAPVRLLLTRKPFA